MIILTIIDKICKENDLHITWLWSIGTNEYYSIKSHNEHICEITILTERNNNIHIYPKGIDRSVGKIVIPLADPECFDRVRQTILKLHKN